MKTLHAKSVFLVDDHPVTRRGLIQLFEAEPDFSVCGEAGGAAEAFEAVTQLFPDLVVTDLSLEGRSGLDLTKQLQAYAPELPVLIVSMHDENLFAERSLQAGARGYVMKCYAAEDILQAAREVLAGRTYISPALRQQIQRRSTSREHPASSSLTTLLSDRELEVFLLIGQGYAPRHIAEKLSLSASTIEVYRERLKEKLGIPSSPLLLRYAITWYKDYEMT